MTRGWIPAFAGMAMFLLAAGTGRAQWGAVTATSVEQHVTGGVSYGQLEDPYVVSVVPGCAGSMTNGTYDVGITSVDATGESWTNDAKVTTACGTAVGSVALTWVPVGGAASYNIYIGSTLATAHFYSNVTGTFSNTVTLTSVPGSGAIAPLGNTTAGSNFAGITVTASQPAAPTNFFLNLANTGSPGAPCCFLFSQSPGIVTITQGKNPSNAHVGELDVTMADGASQMHPQFVSPDKEIDFLTENGVLIFNAQSNGGAGTGLMDITANAQVATLSTATSSTSFASPLFGLQNSVWSATGMGSIAVAGGGSGYAAGNVLTVNGGSTLGAFQVTSVNGSGGVTGLVITYAGAGYSTSLGASTNGGSGTGCTVNVNTLGGVNPNQWNLENDNTNNLDFLNYSSTKVASLTPAGALAVTSLTLTTPLAVSNGGWGTGTGSFTSPGAIALNAGGSNQNITLTPSGTGYTVLNGFVGIGTTSPLALVDIENGALRLGRTGTWPVIMDTSGGSVFTITNGGSQRVALDPLGNVGIGTMAPAQTLDVNGTIGLNGVLTDSITAPTVASGFSTGAPTMTANGTAAFSITIGSTPSSSGVLTFPAASHGWAVHCDDVTTQSTSIFITKQTAVGTTSATLTQYNTAGTATAWVASDVLVCQARAY